MHHLSHVHLLITGRDFKEIGGLRSFLDVPEFHTAFIGVRDFEEIVQLQVKPHLACLAVAGRALVFYGAPPV